MLSENFLRGRRRSEMSPEEKAAIEAVMSGPRTIPPRTVMIRRGVPVAESTLLLSGFACRYMDGRDGNRQLVALQVPGDFVDLHGYPLQRLDHNVASLTAVEIATVPHAELTELVEAFPHLARLMWFSTLLDAAMHREWIFRLGRLDAYGKIAHLLCETATRLSLVGLVKGGSFDFPLTQQDLGEACALTSVHVNRTLQRLREDGLITLSRQSVTIHDFARLALVAEFDTGYLYLEGDETTP